MRPTFDVGLPFGPDVAAERVRARLKHADARFSGVSVGRHAELFVPESERHFWSPWLSVDFEPDEDDESRSYVRCRFAPHPHVWTGFMAGYAIVAFTVLFAGVFGLCQLMLDESPWGLASVPIGAVVAAVLYGASLVGQRLGHDQMLQLQHELETLLDVQLVPEPANDAATPELA